MTTPNLNLTELANQHKKRKQEHDERQKRHQRDVREIASRGEPVVFDKADDKILQKTQRRKQLIDDPVALRQRTREWKDVSALRTVYRGTADIPQPVRAVLQPLQPALSR